MLGIFSDVFKRATFQDAPRKDPHCDWRAPVHWHRVEPDHTLKARRDD